jgi:hypothetical protein
MGLVGNKGDGVVVLLLVAVGEGVGDSVFLVNFSPRLKLHFFFLITLQSA